VLQLLLRSPLAARVERVILDSPALDWHAILAAYVRAANYPRPIAPLAARLLEGPMTAPLVGLDRPIPLIELTARRFAGRLSHPILLIQGDDDPTTPVALAREFEGMRPDLVEYAEFAGAGHVRAWNADSARYEALIEEWLTRE
jgi:pimeloyl-ACP methyl ester carboxylesterase